MRRCDSCGHVMSITKIARAQVFGAAYECRRYVHCTRSKTTIRRLPGVSPEGLPSIENSRKRFLLFKVLDVLGVTP